MIWCPVEVEIRLPQTHQLAADLQLPDGTHSSCGPTPGPTRPTYARVILASIAERQRWRAQYEAAKTLQPVDNSFGNSTGPP